MKSASSSAPRLEENKIINAAGDNFWFTSIPNYIFGLGLSPTAGWLYAYIKQRAGGELGGVCTMSGANLAAALRISTGAVSSAKKELMQAGLIRIVKMPVPGGLLDSITIENVWAANAEVYDTLKMPSNIERISADSQLPSNIERKTVMPSNIERKPKMPSNIETIKKESLKNPLTRESFGGAYIPESPLELAWDQYLRTFQNGSNKNLESTWNAVRGCSRPIAIQDGKVLVKAWNPAHHRYLDGLSGRKPIQFTSLLEIARVPDIDFSSPLEIALEWVDAA